MSKSYDGVELLQIIRACFDNDELKDLCLKLRVDYDSLGGDAKTGKARELVGYLERRGRLVELTDAVRDVRPNAFEFREDLHEHISGQWSKSDSREEWIHMAFGASMQLVRIGTTIKRTQSKQSNLCRLIADATSDLPEQKRTQILNIIENDCSNCKTIWADIESRILNGIEGWIEFIEIHCTDRECNTYTEHLNKERAKLTEVRKDHEAG